MKHSLLLPSLLLAGVAVGLTGIVPEAMTNHRVTFSLLCLLVVQVGLGLGNRSDFPRIIRSLDLRTLALPLFTIVGTLLFTFIGALLLPIGSVRDTMALGSGFGYYSLSSLLILDMRSQALGLEAATALATTALLINIVREVTALLFCGAIARRGRVPAAISVAGINSMDVCLPMIASRSEHQHFIPMAMVHGIALEISVPLLIGLFCM